MARSSSRIAEVAEFLSTGTGTAIEKLCIGGKLLAAALMLPEDWPPAQVSKATKLKASLCKGMKLGKAVEEMTDSAARACLKQFTKEMADLANEIERAKSRRGRVGK